MEICLMVLEKYTQTPTHTNTDTNTIFYFILNFMIAEISDSTMSNFFHIQFQPLWKCGGTACGKKQFENGTKANISLTNGGMHPTLCHSCKLYI